MQTETDSTAVEQQLVEQILSGRTRIQAELAKASRSSSPSSPAGIA
jgi:hypothetical protein